MATQQVELSGLEVVGRLHGAPDALGDLQEQLDLGGHGVELILPLSLTLRTRGQDLMHISSGLNCKVSFALSKWTLVFAILPMRGETCLTAKNGPVAVT